VIAEHGEEKWRSMIEQLDDPITGAYPCDRILNTHLILFSSCSIMLAFFFPMFCDHGLLLVLALKVHAHARRIRLRMELGADHIAGKRMASPLVPGEHAGVFFFDGQGHGRPVASSCPGRAGITW